MKALITIYMIHRFSYVVCHYSHQSAIAKSREKQQINVRKTIDSGRVDVSVSKIHVS
jgi:hypothetical protein